MCPGSANTAFVSSVLYKILATVLYIWHYLLYVHKSRLVLKIIEKINFRGRFLSCGAQSMRTALHIGHNWAGFYRVFSLKTGIDPVFKTHFFNCYYYHRLICYHNLQLYAWNKPFFRVHSVAAVLWLQFMLHKMPVPMLNLWYFYIISFDSIFAAANVPFFFFSSLISCIHGMLLRYCLSDFEMVPVAPIISAINFAFTFHMRCVSVRRYLYFRIFLAPFLITFLSPEIATSINLHFHFSLSRIMTCGLLIRMLLSIRTCWFHNMVGYLTFTTFSDGFWFIVQFYSYFFA